jgi:hypothetical protein
MKFLISLLFIFSASAESLTYNINWPSGLSLGEATLRADRTHQQGADKGPEQWEFAVDIDASVPGFAVKDHYQSTATSDLCTVQLEKNLTHGHRKTDERITFDQGKNTATRETLNGGGKSELTIPACGRDALTFLQFARRELAQGRLAPQQQVVFGAVYQVRVEYTGAQAIKVGEKRIDADRIVATIKGPSTDLTVEVFFSRDAARTPVLAKIPLALGAFTVELAR